MPRNTLDAYVAIVYSVHIGYIHTTRLEGTRNVLGPSRREAGRRNAPSGDSGRRTALHRPAPTGAARTKHEREPELDIIISNASDRPIYDQIVSQMKALILTGELDEGQQLPSIRALAGDLRISVITTKRAYAELEAQGFIETVPGKGSFVAGGNFELLREERLRHIEELLTQAVDEARGANVEVRELHDMLDLIAESDD